MKPIRHPGLRFLVPVATAGILVGGSVLVAGITAEAAPLPERSAAQLIQDVRQAEIAGLSGTVVQTADLGIPSLPGIGEGSSSDLTSLISGTHTLRVWYAGPDKVRLALLGSLGESDVIRNGTDLWMWSSKDNTASHRKLSGAGPATELPKNLPATPQQTADGLLKALDPTTIVSTDSNVVVAGRTAYELVLQPKDSRSLVDRVTVAVDGEHHVPLRVQVFAKGQQSPAFSVGFTSVDFGTPDAAQFAFNPPPGTTITESDTADRPSGHPAAAPGKTAEPRVVGTGWTSVLVVSLPEQTPATAPEPGQKPAAGGLDRIVNALPKVSGAWGSGHLLAGKLFSVLVTDDHRVVAGAVAPELLYQALAAK